MLVDENNRVVPIEEHNHNGNRLGLKKGQIIRICQPVIKISRVEGNLHSKNNQIEGGELNGTSIWKTT